SHETDAAARTEDRRAGEYGLAVLGWQAGVFHFLTLSELGQERCSERAVPQGLHLGRQAVDSCLRHRLLQRKPRPAAHHALRPGAVLQESDPRRAEDGGKRHECGGCTLRCKRPRDGQRREERHGDTETRRHGEFRLAATRRRPVPTSQERCTGCWAHFFSCCPSPFSRQPNRPLAPTPWCLPCKAPCSRTSLRRLRAPIACRPSTQSVIINCSMPPANRSACSI